MLHPNWFYFLRSQARGLLALLPLASAAILLTAFLVGPAGVVASLTTFQSSPANAPTLSPTNTLTPTPQNRPTGTRSAETPIPASISPTVTATVTATVASPPAGTPSPTDTPPPADTPSAATPLPTLPPPTRAPTATPSPTNEAIQMPLLPLTATLEPVSPTPMPTITPKPLLSAGAVGCIVVALILVLAVFAGLFFGVVLKGITSRS